MITNLLYIIYLIYYKPLEEQLYIEIINEIFTLILSEIMIVFTDFVIDIEPKNRMSPAFIGSFVLNITLNIVFVIYY